MLTTDTLTEEFEKHRPQLRSFILRMTASVEDTEDLVQDTYLKAYNSVESFRGESSVKTWLFSIGTNLTKDLLRKKKLWPENVTDICRSAALSNKDFLQEMMHISTTSPHGRFEIIEHVTFCFTCIAKSLPIEQQLALLLKEVYEFKVSEIAGISGKTEAVVKHLLHNNRSKMIDIFDNRCSLVNKQGVCHQCSELNGIFNPKQNFEEEKMKIQMVKDAADGDKQQLFDLRMKIIRGVDPYHSPASELQLHHLQHNKKVIEEYIENNA